MKSKVSLWRTTLIVVAVSVVFGAVAYYKGALQPFGLYRPANALMVIAPYRYAGTWVFDDSAVGLKREPFVCCYYQAAPKELYAKAEKK